MRGVIHLDLDAGAIDELETLCAELLCGRGLDVARTDDHRMVARRPLRARRSTQQDEALALALHDDHGSVRVDWTLDGPALVVAWNRVSSAVDRPGLALLREIVRDAAWILQSTPRLRDRPVVRYRPFSAARARVHVIDIEGEIPCGAAMIDALAVELRAHGDIVLDTIGHRSMLILSEGRSLSGGVCSEVRLDDAARSGRFVASHRVSTEPSNGVAAILGGLLGMGMLAMACLVGPWIGTLAPLVFLALAGVVPCVAVLLGRLLHARRATETHRRVREIVVRLQGDQRIGRATSPFR